MSGISKIILGVGLGTVTLAAGLAAVGTSRTTHVLTVSRPTTASPQAIWELWAEVANRTSWDDGLEWARIDGPFQQGASGQVKLRDQPPRRFQIIECQPIRRYTDRFYLPMGTTMDWHHSVEERGPNQRQVTFRVVANGPTSLVLAPVLRRILQGELPQTVDKLITLAEHPEPRQRFRNARGPHWPARYPPHHTRHPRRPLTTSDETDTKQERRGPAPRMNRTFRENAGAPCPDEPKRPTDLAEEPQ
jgi:hypothetical protein